MASIQAFSTVLMFLGVVLSVASLCTGYWRVFYSISHQHSNPSEHHDITKLLYDGLPFDSFHNYINYTETMQAYTTTGISLTGAIIGSFSFLTEVVRIFFIPPSDDRTDFIIVEVIFGIIASFLETLGVIIYSVAFFREDNIPHEQVEKRFQSVQGWMFLSQRESWTGETVKWYVRPGYSFWMMLASLVMLIFASAARILLYCQLRRRMKEGCHCQDHEIEGDPVEPKLIDRNDYQDHSC